MSADSAPVTKEDLERVITESNQRLDTLKGDLQGEREERIRLEERQRAAAETAKPAPAAPAEFTREQLQEAVDKGSLSEERRDQILDEQRDRRAEAKLDARFAAERETRAQTDSLKADLAAYRVSHPDAWTEGTEDRRRVEREYQFIVKAQGAAKDELQASAYELQALRAAFGESVAVKETTRETRPTHTEIGGGGREAGEEPGAGSGAPKELAGKPDLRTYYQGMIDKGRYKGWDDPELLADMKYVK